MVVRGRSGVVTALGGLFVVAVLVVTSDGAPSSTDTSGLAPSQTTADTVPAPDRPPICRPDDLAVWTARTGPGPEVAVIRLRNDGPERCEAGLWGTAALHPLVEPDVWLDPGATADLVVGPSGRACLRPEAVAEVGFVVGDEQVLVPTALVAVCGWAYRALYPNESSSGPCRGLHATVARGAVVLENRSAETCSIGGLTGVDGAGVAVMAPSPSAAELVAVSALGPGDQAALEAVGVGPAGSCPPPGRVVELRFDGGALATVVLDGCQLAIAVGPVRPWVGGLGGTSVLEVISATVGPG